jgi:hypothetical protein
MDELVERLVANVGVEPAVARKAVGIIFDFLLKEGPADKVRALIASLPDSASLEQAVASASGGGGILGGMGGVMGAGSRLMSAGLSMADVQSVTREVLAFAREKAGEDAVADVVGSIPGLSQFV